MKKMNLLFVFISLLTIKFNAQRCDKAVALYLSSNDFLDNKKSFEYKNDSLKCNIRLNRMFNGKYVTIKTNTQKIKILKDSIFGYLRADGMIVRVKGNDEYRCIFQSDSFCIYMAPLPRNGSSRTNVTPFFYSINIIDTIKKLSISNIKEQYKENIDFIKKIDIFFKYNTDLAQKEKRTNTFKLIQILPINKSLN